MRFFLFSLMLLTLLPVATSTIATETVSSHKHGHNPVEVSSLPEIPGVSLDVMRDAVVGWNIHLKTENFRFTPESVNGQLIPGEGHAHLYVDGKKLSRLYGAWHHLGKLSPGRHTIRVTLNANNHSDLVLHGEPVAASVEVVQ